MKKKGLLVHPCVLQFNYKSKWCGLKANFLSLLHQFFKRSIAGLDFFAKLERTSNRNLQSKLARPSGPTIQTVSLKKHFKLYDTFWT